MGGDGSGARAVGPEAVTRLGADGDEALTLQGIGHAHHHGGGIGHRLFVIAGDVNQQDHLGQFAARRLGGVAHRLDVALVQVFQTRQHHRGFGVDIVLDLHDGGDRAAQVAAEEFQADGTDVGVLTV